MTTFVPELFRLLGNPSMEVVESEWLPRAGRAGRREDFIGEGPLPITAVVSTGGGAFRRVMVRLVDGPGPPSARGVVSGLGEDALDSS